MILLLAAAAAWALDLEAVPLPLPRPARAAAVLPGADAPLVFADEAGLFALDADGALRVEAEPGAVALHAGGEGGGATLWACGATGLRRLDARLAPVEELSTTPCTQVAADAEGALVAAELDGVLWTFVRADDRTAGVEGPPLPEGARLVSGEAGPAWFVPGEAAFVRVDDEGGATVLLDGPADALAGARGTWWRGDAAAQAVQALGAAPIALDLAPGALGVVDLDGDGALDLAVLDPELAALRLLTSSLSLRLDELDARGGLGAGDLGDEGCGDLVLLDAAGQATLLRVLDCPNPADHDGDGWTVDEGDCDDRDGEVFPEAPERCDEVDDDCDGAPDSLEGLDLRVDAHGPAAEVGVPLWFAAEGVGCVLEPGVLRWEADDGEGGAAPATCEVDDEGLTCTPVDEGPLRVRAEVPAEGGAALAQAEVEIDLADVPPDLQVTRGGVSVVDLPLAVRGGQAIDLAVRATATGRDLVGLEVVPAMDWVGLPGDLPPAPELDATLRLVVPQVAGRQSFWVQAVEDSGERRAAQILLDVTTTPPPGEGGCAGLPGGRGGGLAALAALAALLRRAAPPAQRFAARQAPRAVASTSARTSTSTSVSSSGAEPSTSTRN